MSPARMLSAGRVKLKIDREIAFGFGRYERSISRRTPGNICWLVEVVNLLRVFAAFVALSPQFAYSSATFNAHNLAALLGSLLFWRLLRALRDGITAKSLAELALLVVLGFGTKRTFLLAVPAVLFALTWQAIASYRGRDKDRL